MAIIKRYQWMELESDIVNDERVYKKVSIHLDRWGSWEMTFDTPEGAIKKLDELVQENPRLKYRDFTLETVYVYSEE